ncbi:MAG TPA: carbonic anhydrase [Symbiobacteriaceae bacterium]|nr:carbonic anhydrase [Symbiobacteriaceae bacterium]
MSLLGEILEHNRRFVEERERPLTKAPARKVALFTCMDTRLVEFLEPAMGLKRGDAKVIKNAGNSLVHSDDGVIRSLVVAVYALGCEEIYVIGHRDCGMSQLDEAELERRMLERGVPADLIERLHPGLLEWVGAIHDPAANVVNVVNQLCENPLLPNDVPIHGLIFDPASGRLDLLVDGYECRT